MLSLSIPSYALDYTSQRPLSLSSRNINVCAQFPDRMKYSSKPTPRPDRSRNRGQAVSPLQHRHAEQDRRRTAFLRKVRQAGEDQKWRSRGDQVWESVYCMQKVRFANKEICCWDRYFERITSRGRSSGKKNRPDRPRKCP